LWHFVYPLWHFVVLYATRNRITAQFGVAAYFESYKVLSGEDAHEDQ
jgi:hypothetical protein